MDATDLPGGTLVNEEAVRNVLAQVVDPEIPVLTIEDMGILRSIHVEGTAVTVGITPTYSGCPAMEVIEEQVRMALINAGFERVQVERVYSPAWTTDWLSPEARTKLSGIGIAPPGNGPVLCPQCSSSDTRTVSEFGSTACKALMVCTSCGEPFDRFKAI